MATKVLPTTHMVKLKDRQEVAERTIGIWLERPGGFSFEAGQFAELSLTGAQADGDGQPLAFSMASAPEEDTLIFATRMRGGSFKQKLAAMPIGSEIAVEGPFGNFVLHEDTSRPAIFLACGIGITPVRSIVVHAVKAKLEHKITLFYSNRRPEDAAFLEELRSLESLNSNYRFIGVMTQMDKSQWSWNGERGYISYEMILKYLNGAARPVYYVVGSPAIVGSLRTMLADAGVKKDDIRSEDFVGY